MKANFQSLIKLNYRVYSFELQMYWSKNIVTTKENECFRLAQTWLLLHLLFESIIEINAIAWRGVYSRATFIDFSAITCGFYARATFIDFSAVTCGFYARATFIDFSAITCGVYSRAAFIDFSAITCGFYARAAFNRINRVCVLDVIENASIDLRPHYRLMRFPQSTLKRSETIELNVVV